MNKNSINSISLITWKGDRDLAGQTKWNLDGHSWVSDQWLWWYREVAALRWCVNVWLPVSIGMERGGREREAGLVADNNGKGLLS